MRDREPNEEGWIVLERTLQGLPPEDQAAVLKALRAYLHDLRGAVGQGRTAASLLARELDVAELDEDLQDLFSVIEVAGRNADGLLDGFSRRLDHLVES